MSNGSIETLASSDLVTKASSQEASRKPQISLFPRSASQTHLSSSEQTPNAPHRRSSLRRTLSDNALTRPESVLPRPTSLASFRRRSSSECKSIDYADSKVTLSQLALGPKETADDAEFEQQIRSDVGTSKRQNLRRSISGSISKIARRSMISASPLLSPSLHKNTVKKASEISTSKAVQSSKTPNNFGEKEPHSFIEAIEDFQQNGSSRRDNFLRKNPKSLSALLSRNSDGPNSCVPPIPTTFSTEMLPSLQNKRSNITDTTAYTSSVDSIQSSGTETPRKKDELWGVFRNLDGEYLK